MGERRTFEAMAKHADPRVIGDGETGPYKHSLSAGARFELSAFKMGARDEMTVTHLKENLYRRRERTFTSVAKWSYGKYHVIEAPTLTIVTGEWRVVEA